MVLLEELSLFQKLVHADYAMMLKLNRDWQIPFFDTIALFIRESTFWVPLYVFLLFYITINYGRKGFWWAVALVGLVALTDLCSSQFV